MTSRQKNAMRERRIKAREQARARERAAATVPESEQPPPPPDRPWLALGLIALVGVVIAGLLWFVWAPDVRYAILSATCTVTGCRPGAMATLGYLSLMCPLAYVTVAIWHGAHEKGGNLIAWALGGVVSLIIGILLVGGGDSAGSNKPSFSPGADASLHGVAWGVVSYLCTLSAVGFVGIIAMRKGKDLSDRTMAVLAAISVVVWGGGIAVNAPLPNYMMTTQIFPDTFMIAQGDVLTRVSATDLDGCEKQFEDCRRTAEFEYTTDDSDAVVRLRIVSFPDNDRAWDAWGTLREPDVPAVLQEANVTGEWLLLSTVRHADGRAIAEGDKKWLRWPAKQLEWAFRDAIGYSLTYPPEASETAAPRTP